MIRTYSMTCGCCNWFIKPYGLSLWWFMKLSLLQPLTDSGPETGFLSESITQNHPRWKGPYMAVLTTLTTHKVDGITSSVHFSHACPSSFLHTKRDLFQWDTGSIQTLHQPPKGQAQVSFLILLMLMLVLSVPAKEESIPMYPSKWLGLSRMKSHTKLCTRLPMWPQWTPGGLTYISAFVICTNL